MLNKYLRWWADRKSIYRFRKIFEEKWPERPYKLYLRQGRILEIIVEMRDPTQNSGVADYFGKTFEDFALKIKKAPPGYIGAYCP